MDRDLDANVHLITDNVFSVTISKTHEVLQISGLGLGRSSSLLLYDPCMEVDFDLEPATSIENVIARMRTWPFLGFVGYEYENYIVGVSFRKYREKESIHCVSLSFPETMYRNKFWLEKIRNLVARVHKELDAVRTISDIEIESDYFDYTLDGEIELLEAKRIKGKYWMDIINQSYFDINIADLSDEDVVEIKELDGNIYIEREREYIQKR